MLREFFPAALDAFGTDLAPGDALRGLARASTPALGKGGQQRNVDSRAAAIQGCLRAPRLDPPPAVSAAYGVQVRSAVAVIAEMTRQIELLEAELAPGLESHPDAPIVRSRPGPGTVLGARVRGEFGDDTTRDHDAGSRENYPGTSPLTKASGQKKAVPAR